MNHEQVEAAASTLAVRLNEALLESKPWDKAAAEALVADMAGPDWDIRIFEVLGQQRFRAMVYRYNPPRLEKEEEFRYDEYR